jgi:hypothetical protein
MRKLICLLFVTALLLAAPPAWAQKGAGQKGGGAGKRAVELSITSPSAVDAKCALARLLAEGEVTSPAMLSQVESFAARKGMFFPTAHLLTYYAEVPALVEALMNRPAPISQQLAAASLACAALGDYLEAEKRTTLNSVAPEEDDSGAIMTGPKKGAKKKRNTGGLTIPVALLTNKVAVTAELALLAAAYTGASGVKEQVDTLPASGGLVGAKLLYYARTGAPVTEGMVAAAFAPGGQAPVFIKTTGPELASFELLLPKEAYACEALGLLKDGKYLKQLHPMLGHPDLRVQMEAVRAIQKIASHELLPFLQAKLNTCEWPVLVDLCQALAALPAKESVPPLLARLKKETGRFRLDVTYALSAIAGEQIGQEHKEWEAWWSKKGAEFKVDEAASQAFRSKRRVQDIRVPDLGYFYSLRIYSDHFSYVVDSSNSMKGDKMDNLRSNLGSSIESLRPWVQFNIADFGGLVAVMNHDALTKDKWRGKTYTREMTHSQGTRIYDAIEAAGGVKGVDTLLLLTDGAPVHGQINPWRDLYRAMTIMNRYRPLIISTVAFQPTDRAVINLKQMANENHGQSVTTN